MKKIVFILFLLFAINCQGTEYDVGGGSNDFATLTAVATGQNLVAGDIVNVYPGTHTDKPRFGVSRTVSGTVGNPVTIRGVDSEGIPVLTQNSPVIFDFTDAGVFSDGAMYFNDATSYVVVQGLTFQNTPYTVGSANVPLQFKSDNATVRYCLFKDNYQTVSAGPECTKLTIEYCEFSGGYSGSHGTTHPHQMYTFSDELIVQFSYFHDFIAPNGQSHVIKSRDLSSTVRYNVLVGYQGMDNIIEYAQTDTAYVGKMPSLTIGNLIVIPNGVTGVASFIKHSDDQNASGANTRPGDMIVISNTMINLSTSDIAAFYTELEVDDTSEISNNIIVGADHLQHSLYPFTMSGTNNWMQTGVALNESGGEVVGLAASIYGASPDYDVNYIPVGGGDLDGAASAGTSVTATFLPYLSGSRPSSLDIGAYEYVNPPPTCDIDHLNLCDETNCAAAGGNWCTSVCQAEACPAAVQAFTWGGAIINSVQQAN